MRMETYGWTHGRYQVHYLPASRSIKILQNTKLKYVWLGIYCRTGKNRVQEIFADFRGFANISCK